MHNTHEMFMQRCIQLARLGAGNVAPNPMVGALLVYNDRIIGEGYHRKYGEAHAEVNCINSVKQDDINLIHQSTLYVSLEPCVHFGKTPPCTDLILRCKIPQVVIGCRDSFTKVNGRGIEKLMQNGVAVTVGILEHECLELNRSFFIFHSQCRPYIILKWAQTADNKIAYNTNKRLLISNKLTNKIVHKWRSEVSAILIGTNTAAMDDPALTNRFWSGNHPIRLVLDLKLRLNKALKIFSDETSPSIIFNVEHQSKEFHQPLNNQAYYYKLISSKPVTEQILKACYDLKIQSVLIEGGTKLIQSFIDNNYWNETRIITNTNMQIGEGLNAPVLSNGNLIENYSIENNAIKIIRK